jgi:Na+/H+ antiporter NhaD/arsenite permease-like protein
LQRAVPEDPQFRKLLGAIVVVAANAGGAFTPIGDVTTTVCAQIWMRYNTSTAMHAGGVFAGV